MDVRRLSLPVSSLAPLLWQSLVKKTFFITVMVVCYSDVAKCRHSTSAFENEGGFYDSFATTKCLERPLPPLYGGGLIANSELNEGLHGWKRVGDCKLEVRSSSHGNNFVVASERQLDHDSPAQKLNLIHGYKYTLSAWVQISGGSSTNAIVKATVVLHGGKRFYCAGTVIARRGCWTLLKGGLAPDRSDGSATLYFESPDTSVEIWLDSVSLQPFSDHEWHSHQKASIEKNRKRAITVHAADSKGQFLKGAKVNIEQKRMGFPLGCAVAKTILGNVPYQEWFLKRFNAATFENELKWYYTEPEPGKVNYKDADALLAFCKEHNITRRGHNIFWEDPQYTPEWVEDLGPEELRRAVELRIRSVLGRYKGEFISWDVSNEVLHYDFYEGRLGANASSRFFKIAQELDPRTPMYMNEYNTVETCDDLKAIPDAYLRRLHSIERTDKWGVIEGIGLESHFSKPNLPLLRSALDKMGSTGLPIWITELDVTNTVDHKTQAEFLEEIIKEVFSHPAVDGIVLWSAWHPEGCYRMCLTDNNFNNLPAGNVVDRLIKRWTTNGIEGNTDDNGAFQFSGFLGEYTATITHSDGFATANFMVRKEDNKEHHHILIHI